MISESFDLYSLEILSISSFSKTYLNLKYQFFSLYSSEQLNILLENFMIVPTLSPSQCSSIKTLFSDVP